MFSKLIDSLLKKESSSSSNNSSSCNQNQSSQQNGIDTSSAINASGAHTNIDDHQHSTFSSSTSSQPKNYYRELPVEHVLKIVILGGHQVGKSSIIRRYLQECFTNSYIPTIGTDLSTLILEPANSNNSSNGCSNSSNNSSNIPTNELQIHNQMKQHQSINLNLSSTTLPTTTTASTLPLVLQNSYYYIQFLDVPQAEIRGKHVSSIFNGVTGVIMMFDSTNASSIVSIDEWKNVLRRYNLDHRIPIALFANKSDLGDPVINHSDLDNYCKACEYNFWKFTSAKKDHGVKDGVEKLLDLILERKQQELESKKRSTIITIQTSDSRHGSQKLNKDRMISQSMPTMMLNPSTSKLKSIDSPVSSNNTTPLSTSPSQSSTPSKDTTENKSNEPTTPSSSSSSSTSTIKTSTDESTSNGPVLVSSVQPERPKLQPSDILKLTELQNLATEFYGNIGKQLEELLQRSMGSRYKDLSMLEKQRSHEYLKICNCLKKLLQPHLHMVNGGPPRSSHKSITKEIVQSALEENIKKWNTLMENLHLESALDSQQTLSSSLKLDSTMPSLSSSNLNASFINASSSSSLSTISEEGGSTSNNNNSNHSLMNGSHHVNSINSTNNSITNNRYNPQRQISQSLSTFESNHKHNHHHHHHHHHKSSNNGKWKMGFGFRNNGRNPSIQVPSSNYNLDTDNPVSSSSTMSSTSSSSSSRSVSPLASPSSSPTNSLQISSPSILPSSYDLTVHNLPQTSLSTSLSNNNSFHDNLVTPPQ